MKLNLLFVLVVVGLVCFCGCEKKDAAVEVKTEAPAVAETGEVVVQDAVAVKVELATTLGVIVLELNAEKAPVTVENFLGYVNSGFYDGLVFHRIIPGFMIQTGGFSQDYVKQDTRDAIVLESDNGLSNLRGTIAMARTGVPDSATCQFFINHADNTNLDYRGDNSPGYAVFGKVVEGMDVADAIATAKQRPQTAKSGQPLQNCPAEPIIIISAKVVK